MTKDPKAPGPKQYARDLMTYEIVTLRLDDEISMVDDLTPWRHFKTLPVVDEANRLLGLVSYQSLLKGSILEGLAKKNNGHGKIRVRDVMSTDYTSVAPTSPISEVAAALKRTSHGFLPVVSAGLLVGVITSSDLNALIF